MVMRMPGSGMALIRVRGWALCGVLPGVGGQAAPGDEVRRHGTAGPDVHTLPNGRVEPARWFLHTFARPTIRGT